MNTLVLIQPVSHYSVCSQIRSRLPTDLRGGFANSKRVSKRCDSCKNVNVRRKSPKPPRAVISRVIISPFGRQISAIPRAEVA